MFCHVKPQSHIIEIAVKQEINCKLRAVYCCELAWKPMLSP